MPVLRDGELYLYGFVGENYWGEGFTAGEVLDALVEIGRETDVTVHVNSPGGYASEGVAIYNAFKAHKGKVSIVVDAIAASSASVIAMGGYSITMRSGALMMIHDPAAWTSGDVEEHRKTINYLDKTAAQLASIYAEATGESVEDMRALMKAETWLTADEAVAQGFATLAETAKAVAVAAFDYRTYAHAPKQLKTLARSKKWSIPTDEERAASAARATAQTQELDMSHVTADANAADLKKATKDAADAAVTAYKARVKDVKALAEYAGREALAEELIETDLPVDRVKAMLAAAPAKAEAAPPADPGRDYDARRQSATAGLAAIQPGAARGAAKPKLSAQAIFAERRKQTQEG